MSNASEMVSLCECLRRSDEQIELIPDQVYRQIRMRLWGNGPVERGKVYGSEIAAPRQSVARSGQFIISRIDARNGASGLVPGELDGAVVSNDFLLFNVDEQRLLAKYLMWLSKTKPFVALCRAASEGTTNRVRLKEDRFLSMRIPLPQPSEQRLIVGYIEGLVQKVEEAKSLTQQAEEEHELLLHSVFTAMINSSERRPMREVAPLVRRPVTVHETGSYPELGIRSFGRGTFHKPSLVGAEVGNKRLYEIHPGDLVFNNVFAWEGAVAIAQPQDRGRFGSHRFLTCVPHPDIAMATFVWFYFQTTEGMEALGEASPGGAGRNRTLNLRFLENIEVPVPDPDEQRRFDGLLQQRARAREERAGVLDHLNAFTPSLLDRAFGGEL